MPYKIENLGCELKEKPLIMSNFSFLAKEYPEISALGMVAERSLFFDPSNTLTKLRIISEKITLLLLEYDEVDNEVRFTQIQRLNLIKIKCGVPEEILDILHSVRKSGNDASHEGTGSLGEARFLLRKMFYVCVWFYELYEDDVSVEFQSIEKEEDENQSKIKELESELASMKSDIEDKDSKIKALSQRSEEEIIAFKEKSKRLVRKMDETEAETRDRIDQQLRESGWECDTLTLNYKTRKSLPSKNTYKAIAEWPCNKGYADYALFIGLELVGIVEAKKHAKSVQGDLEQSRRYSKEVGITGEITFPAHNNSFVYKIPFLFATNGRKFLEQYKTASGIWFWDARRQNNLEKALPNWFSPKDLKEKLAFSEENGEESLKKGDYEILSDSKGLNLRYYQIDAIKALETKILNFPEEPRALIAMATGTGKTRTMIGMCYRLIKSGRFRRILFLVDRRMLGNQAADAFKEVKIEGLQTFGQIYDLQDLGSAVSELDTKIHFATVQGMVHRVVNGDSPPSVGEYDCIVVDEAHRGYTLDRDMDSEELLLSDQEDFQSKYRMVLDHFDAYRIGLTATPAAHTESIFGKPVYEYSYRKAVVDGFLKDFEPPYVFITELNENGIIWQKGDPIKIYDPEENEIIEAGTTEDEVKVEIQSFNKRVIIENFNKAVLSELISNPEYNIHLQGPQKTLIFAASDIHADLIVKVLKEQYEEMGEEVDADSIMKITGYVDSRELLLSKYKNDQYPSIVVTVDLLTTGVDVPAICNLVFLRRVNSRILYDQMLGRATRLCDDIGKEAFKVFDCVGVTKIMAEENVMKPVAPLVTKSFDDLVNEAALIEDEKLIDLKLDRIIAKLYRKTSSFSADQNDHFTRHTQQDSPQSFATFLKSKDSSEIASTLKQYDALWEYLDKQKADYNRSILFSEHEDTFKEAERAYFKNLKPKDYIDSFSEFVRTKRNEVMALNIVCTKPQNLTRADLKELRLLLDEEGYSNTKLNTAFKQMTNHEIVADIISLVRTASLGTPLIDHKVRISNACKLIKDSRSWNSTQIAWLDRIEKQLLQESIITLEDLNQAPFSNDGGLKRLDKIFKGETAQILEELNNYLYA